jgi:predicted dehydrogenase
MDDVVGGSSAPLRWAIIGTGRISRSMVADLRELGADVTRVHSRDPERASAFAVEFGIPRSRGDLDEVLRAPDVDVVYLATPFATHVELARRALQARKHVLVEKPMAMRADDVRELFQLARRQGRFLMEAMWMKFNPAFHRLRDEIASGRIGDVRAVRAGFGVPLPEDGGSHWDPARSGGALFDKGIYPVTLAHGLLGRPEVVTAVGRVRADGLDLAEHFLLGYGDGRHAYGSSSIIEFADLSAAVSGTRGWIVLPPLFWTTTTLEIHAGGWEQLVSSPEVVELPREGNGYVPMLRAVTGAIEDGRLEHPEHDEHATVEVFETLERILQEVRRFADAALPTGPAS